MQPDAPNFVPSQNFAPQMRGYGQQQDDNSYPQNFINNMDDQ